ncbi:hypothetical protein C2E25_12465 [Geothermobacter hydrogeniphilus]|uniref:Uncharacterized protein n=1 Tax=Geothermobacter hydrogeniphilus TaxID=1969733 RepID=A0A2K2H875_9BACT|nr:hypothetical protein [Geothermobacter hydrogeniphilus]PNU19467.1 hypothetical protein C2E25_12465 [Geothermobacter hydrogeniphilus]
MKLRVVLLAAGCVLLLSSGLWFARPLPEQSPLSVQALVSVADAPDGRIRVALAGSGFDRQTRVSLLPDIGNRHMVRGELPFSGMINGMARKDNLLLLADSPDGLIICDISQPSAPSVLASLPLPGTEWKVAVVGSLALITSVESGLQLVNISDPSSPHLLGTLAFDGPVHGLVCRRDKAYIAVGERDFLIVDFSDPKSPEILRKVSTPDRVVGLAISGDRLLVADGHYGLLIFPVRENGDVGSFNHITIPGQTRQVRGWKGGALAMTRTNLYFVPAGGGESPKAVFATEHDGFISLEVGDDTVYLGTNHGVMLVRPDSSLRSGQQGFIATTGSVRAVAAAAGTLYIGDARTGLKYLPVPDFDKIPVAAGFSLLGNPAFFTVTGDRLLVATQPHGLVTYRLDGRREPILDGQLYQNWSIACIGRGAGRFFLGSNAGELIVVARVGPRLEVRDRLPLPGLPRAIVVRDGMLLVADDLGGILCFSLVDPDHPRSLGGLSTTGRPHGMAFSGRTLLVAEGEAGIRTVEMSPDGRLRSLQQQRMDQSVVALAVSEDRVLVLLRSGQLALFRLRPGGRLIPLGGTLDLPRVTAIAAGGGYFYVRLGNSGLGVLRPTSRGRKGVELIRNIPLTNSAGALRAVGGTLLVADGSAGVRFFSLAVPARPEQVQVLPVPRGALDMLLDNESLLVFNDKYCLSLHLLARSERAPVLLGDVGLGFDLVGNLAILVTVDRLQVIDLSTPGSMKVLGSLPLPAKPGGIKVRGDLAYVACGRAGLMVIDLSNPRLPLMVGRLSLAGTARNVVVEGTYALVASGREGLAVVNISRPREPKLVRRLQLAAPLKDMSDFYDVRTDGRYVYIADLENGLVVAALRKDGTIRAVGHLQTYGRARSLSLRGGRVYIADLSGGVQAIDVSRPSRPRLIGRIVVPGMAKQVLVGPDFLWLRAAGSKLFQLPDVVEAGSVSLAMPGRLEAVLPRPTADGYYTLRVSGPNGEQEIPGAIHVGPSPSHRSGAGTSEERP